MEREPTNPPHFEADGWKALDALIAERYEETFEARRRAAAKSIWHKRHHCAPNLVELKRVTWAHWWNRVYGRGETLQQYFDRLKSEQEADHG